MVMKSDDIGELAKALALAQPKVKGAIKDAVNPHLKNRYADLGSTWDACREALAEHGLSVVQLPTPVEVYGGDGQARTGMALDTVLAHSSGQWIGSRIVLDSGGGKGLNPMQSLGSAISYARRYGLAAIVGVCPEDDDGESLGPSSPVPGHLRRKTNGVPQVTGDRGQVTDKFDAEVAAAVEHWDSFEPIADADERTRREDRIANALVTLAVKDGKARESAVMRPAEPGKDAKRDRAKVWAEARRLWRDDPGYVRNTIEYYLDEKRSEVEPVMAGDVGRN